MGSCRRQFHAGARRAGTRLPGARGEAAARGRRDAGRSGAHRRARRARVRPRRRDRHQLRVRGPREPRRQRPGRPELRAEKRQHRRRHRGARLLASRRRRARRALPRRAVRAAAARRSPGGGRACWKLRRSQGEPPRRRLEYRGYDSCGVAVLFDGQIGRVRSVARVADLAIQIGEKHFGGATGIAHTRWATHGAPATENAHPLVSHGEIALVHNGIIENHEELRAELQAAGYRFESQTDTEVIAHLVHSFYRGDLAEAVRAAVKRLAGAYAIAVLASKEPHRVVGARFGSPLVVGVGEKELFLASDALALAGTTERIAYLEDGDVASIDQEGWRVVDRDGRTAPREVRTVKTASAAAEL